MTFFANSQTEWDHLLFILKTQAASINARCDKWSYFAETKPFYSFWFAYMFFVAGRQKRRRPSKWSSRKK